MENEQAFGSQGVGGPVNGNEATTQPAPGHEPSMPVMFDQAGQPLAASSNENTMASHGPIPTQPQPMHLPAQSLLQQQQLSGPGPLPRTANSSAPQTPMMDVEPTSATSVGRAQTPQSSQSANQNDRQLNVTDALSYLDAVKSRFHDRTDVYNRFLDIMKDFKTQVIDTPGVIERVSQLFNAHPDLIHGFNTFLPVGYRIETGSEGTIVVRTPQGTSTIPSYQSTLPPAPQSRAMPMPFHPTAPSVHSMGVSNQQPPYHGAGPVDPSMPAPAMMNLSGVPSPGLYPPGPAHDGAMQHSRIGTDPAQDQQTEFQRAINYVNKIKIRFTNDPETYKMFLELLQRHRDGGSDVQPQMFALLKNEPDLQAEFKEFWPDGRPGILGSVIAAGSNDWASNHKRKDPSSTFGAPPAKRKKKQVEKEPPPTKPSSSSRQVKKPKPHPREDPAAGDYMYENGVGV